MACSLTSFTSLLKCDLPMSHDELLYHRSKIELKDGGVLVRLVKERERELSAGVKPEQTLLTRDLGEIVKN